MPTVASRQCQHRIPVALALVVAVESELCSLEVEVGVVEVVVVVD